MFPVETLVPAYCEERAAENEAKRLARQQQQEAAKKHQQETAAATATAAQSEFAQTQRPPLSHTNSSGFLGNIFSGIMKSASATPSTAASQSPTPSKEASKNAAGVSATGVTAELEKLKSEQQRDVDYLGKYIVPFPDTTSIQHTIFDPVDHTMSSQQLKRSAEKAPHTEPGVAEDKGRSPTSLDASAGDDTDQRRQSNIKGKTPTGLGTEPLNIVILGASFGGLSCAHHFLDYTITKLRTTSTAPNYRLIIISPSTHIYWNIGAPRALVGPGLIKHEDAFIPIEPGFHRHRGHQFTIIQGECKTMDKDSRTVTIELIGSTAQRRAHSDLLSLHGPHLNTIGALNTFHSKVEGAKSIVVCGGGCSGVETAGQLATFLNYSSHFPVRRRIKTPKKIFLITGSDRCLPLLKPKVGQKAEKMLKNLGVEIKHNIRVTAVKEEFDLTGQSKLELSDDTEMITDLYIPCTGVGPNSQYAPPSLRDARDYILTNGETMRVDAAGPRTYCIGDVASYSHNYVLDVYAAVPVVMHNLLNDLIAHELRLASPYGGNQEKIDALTDEVYVQRHVDSQLCPISRFGGVGILMDKSIPRYMVHRLKGHDYRVCKANNVVVNGGNPYAIKTAMGNKYE
ncbi:hypothetical protein D0863_05901 [Hortaea werneckii]|uniref:FAD/NAD(P)-binding domain-containing protein n=1 Tax=Hortaea werneckii TaxID=91943 RepID=A0A3M7E2J7_HORWE|nr:hypothetical protein D0863_05901 [Hortaea werneckii]